ncbi:MULTISPECIES: hypothetical protein [Paenibacillus]|uniref:Uncharacterized protein n=1 Tax=Paenibacillus lignilyticus TaxID=1172615 RepID=A0ABS5CEW5_9BACL|nr:MULTISPECIES: hypothetical protein [Paenibacillus]MBP3964333.1 hypothetical protein [Paenibacillus lignilyticus]SFS83608.1 hypothetical protein SAMN05428962_3145 [Paenibacillus sp. BC26]
MWQQLWFLTNMVFVTLAIVFLFVHRSVTLAKEQSDQMKLAKAKRVRMIVAIFTSIAFVVMATFFLINMRVNG